MGANKIMSYALICIFIELLSFGDVKMTNLYFSDLDGCRNWANNKYLSYQLEIISVDNHSYVIILGSYTSGTYSCEIFIFKEVKQGFEYFDSRSTIFDKVILEKDAQGLLILRGSNGKVLETIHLTR